mgnify:CR=1 FL=1
MKKYILLFTCLITVLSVDARNRNYIYVFDCTQSMDSEFGIWEDAKKWLYEDIKRKQEDALITIVPFRDKSDGVIPPFIRKDMNWRLLENRFDALISSPHSKTGICKAWDEAVQYIRPGFENWFILLTDGKDEYDGSSEVQRRMREWCMYHSGCNAYVVTLSATAKEALWTDLSNCDDIDIIDGSGFIPIIGTFDNTPLSMLANSPRNFIVSFSEEGVFKAHIESNDKYYNINLKDNSISNEEATIIITEKSPNIRPIFNHEISFNIISDEREVKFRKSDFTILVDPRDLSNVDFIKASNDEFNGGTLQTYSRFIFYPGKSYDEVSIDLGALFNDQAKIQNASMFFTVNIPKNLQGKCKLFFNEKEINNSFELLSNADGSILTIRIPHIANEGKYYIELKGNGSNLESVNAELSSSYNTTIYVKHIIGWNPLKTILFWIFIVFVICILCRIIYSHTREGVCCGVDYIINGSREALVRKRKANRIIISSKVKKQNWVDWLFNGKTLYNIEPVPGLRSDICFNAAKLKRSMRVRCKKNNDYYINGLKMRRQILTANEDVKHVITGINDIELLTLIIL